MKDTRGITAVKPGPRRSRTRTKPKSKYRKNLELHWALHQSTNHISVRIPRWWTPFCDVGPDSVFYDLKLALK